MKSKYRAAEIIILATWIASWYINYCPGLIRALCAVIGMALTAPQMYSGIVKRETVNLQPLDRVLDGYTAVNLKASEKDLQALGYPGKEKLSDLSERRIIVDKFDYSINTVKDRCVLVLDGDLPEVPTVYLGLDEVVKVAKTTNITTSIPCLMVMPNRRQVFLSIG